MDISPQALDGIRSVYATAHESAPVVGRRVTLSSGKHKGKSGVVTWHGRDSFDGSSRYETSWIQAGLRQAAGRHGYRIRVQFDDGTSAFTKAEYATVK